MNLPLRASVALMAIGVLNSCTRVKDDTSGDSAFACESPSVTAVADMSVVLGTSVTVGATGAVCIAKETPIYTWAVESVPVDSAIDSGDLDLTDPAAPSFMPDK